MARREPRWVIPFLRALERTGEVRTAAVDAGIDHSTAYARRKAHAEFAAAWDAALRAHEEGVARGAEEELAALRQGPSTIRPAANGPPPPVKLGEDLVAVGAQVKRAGHDRWSQAKERAFFDALAATANVKRAAAAAGVSPNAVYARRSKHPLFKAKWAAVLETAQAAIEMKLVEAANRSFDPDELDTGAVDVTLGNPPADGRAGPVVSVAEAIRIVQLHGTRKQQEQLPDPFAEQAASMDEEDIEEVRERILRRFRRIRERDRAEQLTQGWSYDEQYDHMIPPGWVRAAD